MAADLVEETLSNIDTIYTEGGDRDETLAKLERLKDRVDGLIEDLI